MWRLRLTVKFLKRMASSIQIPTWDFVFQVGGSKPLVDIIGKSLMPHLNNPIRSSIFGIEH